MNLLEGVKISKSLLSAALQDPNFTFGIEAEFFLVGAQALLRQQMTQDLDTADVNGRDHFVKKLGDMTWHDILHYFTPLGVDENDLKHEHEIMNDRLLDAYRENDASPEEAWAGMSKEYGVHEMMALLRVFPDGRIVGVPENQVEAIRDIVYDSDVEEISPFRKLNNVDVALARVGQEKESLNVHNGYASRDAIYNMVAKELTQKLGAKVAYTTDSNYAYNASNAHEYWALTEDGSLFDTEAKTDAVRMELISPVMTAQEGLQVLMQILQIMNEG